MMDCFQYIPQIQDKSLTSYMQFPKVSSVGSSSGPVAWTGKGTSMKGKTVTSNEGIHAFHYQLSLGTSGYTLTQSAAFI